MGKPKISVLMSVYNAEKYLKKAIDSILNQTFKDFEFIIINDGSTDKTKEIINSFGDDRVILIENDENIGTASSLNKGIRMARGKYIARMDADDISLSDRLQQQYNFLEENKEIGIVGTCSYLINNNDKRVGKLKRSSEHYLIKWKAFFGFIIFHPTIMARQEVLKNNFYNKDYLSSQDRELWSRLLFQKNIKFANLESFLFEYRLHDSSISKTKPINQKIKSNKVILGNVKKYIKINNKEETILEKFLLNKYNIFDINNIAYLYKKLANSYIDKDKLNIDQAKIIKNKIKRQRLNLYKQYFKRVLRNFLKF